MSFWVDWHAGYDEPGGHLAQRLQVVQRFIRLALDVAPDRPTILSLCSGDGRDLIGVLRSTPLPVGQVVLVDINELLAQRATDATAAAGLHNVEVRVRDAGHLDSFADVLPVDVLLMCGIFGNIEHQSIRTLVECSNTMVKPGGFVLWTRAQSEPDRRPEIRGWFTECGFEEIAFEGAPQPYGVGLDRCRARSEEPPRLPERLFTFRQSSG